MFKLKNKDNGGTGARTGVLSTKNGNIETDCQQRGGYLDQGIEKKDKTRRHHHTRPAHLTIERYPMGQPEPGGQDGRHPVHSEFDLIEIDQPEDCSNNYRDQNQQRQDHRPGWGVPGI